MFPTRSEAVFREDVTVELIKSSASDSDVIYAAQVSTRGEQTRDLLEPSCEESEKKAKREAGLINYLMRDRHGSPFEHTTFTFYIEGMIFAFREFMRHRIASYNEESGRYREMRPVFYVPSKERNLVQEGKVGAYEFTPGTDEQIGLVQRLYKENSLESYDRYIQMLDAGIAREVARGVLPLNLFSSMYVTMNARALMNFLSLRTKRDDTHFPSFPQREIEMIAEKMEECFASEMPITYAAFNKNGRVAP